MPTFKGQPVFRGRDGQAQEWAKTAHRAISQGGRIYKSQSGDMHIVSPAGSHWGSFSALPQKFEGGSLKPFTPEDDAEDITDKYR